MNIYGEEHSEKFTGLFIKRNHLLNKELSSHEKIILSEIMILNEEGKGCWASNRYLSAFVNLSERQVRKVIGTLAEKEYIFNKVIKNEKGTFRSLEINRNKTINTEYLDWGGRNSSSYGGELEGHIDNSIDNNTKEFHSFVIDKSITQSFNRHQEGDNPIQSDKNIILQNDSDNIENINDSDKLKNDIVSEPEIKKETITLKEKDMGIIEMIRRWSAHPQLANHKLPEKPGDEMTKTISNIIKYVRQLRGKRFIRVNKPILPEKYKEPAWTEELIDYCVEQYVLKFSDKYYPEYKGNLTKSFSDFIFNPRTGKSELLEIVSTPPALLSGEYDDKLLSDAHIRSVTQLFGESGSCYQLPIKRALHRLYGEIEKIENDVGKMYRKHTKWGTEFGTRDMFVKRWIEYLKSYKDGITVGHLATTRGKRVWDRFVEVVKDNYHYNLYATEAEKKIIMMRRKNYFIRELGHDPGDFHDGGVYLKTEIEDNK